MSIAANRTGIHLEEFIPVHKEENLANYSPLSGAFAAISVNGKLLLGYNIWRNQWELPAGKIERGEKPKDAAIRELYEETHQVASDLSICGVFRIFDANRNEVRYRVMYYGKMDTLAPFEATAKDEMSKITLWDFKKNIGYIDTVDLKMVELALGSHKEAERY